MVLYLKLPEGGYRCRHMGSLISETYPSRLERPLFCEEKKKKKRLVLKLGDLVTVPITCSVAPGKLANLPVSLFPPVKWNC